jgi:hypothetical protein
MNQAEQACSGQERSSALSRRTLIGAALGMAAVLAACERRAAGDNGLPAVVPAVVPAAPPGTTAPAQFQAEVWKTPYCGCCKGWVKHLQDSGFAVVAHDVPDTAPKRAELGIPEKLGSCHSARIGGYAIEGHVPAADIKRLLAEKPDAVGLAVPGMPIGSPGMEQGDQRDKYDVLLVRRGGQTSVYSSHS